MSTAGAGGSDAVARTGNDVFDVRTIKGACPDWAATVTGDQIMRRTRNPEPSRNMQKMEIRLKRRKVFSVSPTLTGC